MAIIKLDGTYMALPSAIKRGNPIPLDTTSVWYDKTAMEQYAATSVTAYVGQILSLVNEGSNSATAYMIMDATGTLQEVGSAVVADNKTISLNNEGELALKNWGKQYYKWVAGATEDEPGTHVLQVVDEANPWIAGLEPKVSTTTDGTLEIAWYQPSTTTIEGVSSAVTTVQNTVNNLSAGIGTSEDAAGADTVYGEINQLKTDNTAINTKIDSKVGVEGGTLTGDLVLKDGSKAASEAVVDTKVAAAIGSAGHLKREIVDALPAVDAADADTIYMLKVAGESTYREYILVTIEGVSKFEEIGDTKVDLTNYVQKVSGALNGNFAALNTEGALIDSGKKPADFVEATEYTTFKTETTAALSEKVSTTNETWTSLSTHANKLANLPEFSSISDGLEVKAGGALAIKISGDNGLSVNSNGLTLAAASATSAGAMTIEQFNKLNSIAENAQVNKIEGALLGPGGKEIPINENKKLIIPIAGSLTLGLVKSSNLDNNVSVANDGTMTINAVSTTKLYVPEEDELILDGGNA